MAGYERLRHRLMTRLIVPQDEEDTITPSSRLAARQ